MFSRLVSFYPLPCHVLQVTSNRERRPLFICPWEEPSRPCCGERATSWSCLQEHVPPKRSLAQRGTHCSIMGRSIPALEVTTCQGCLVHWQLLSQTWCLAFQSWSHYDILLQEEVPLCKKMKCQRDETLAQHSAGCQFYQLFSKMSIFIKGENRQNFSSLLEQKMFPSKLA